MEVSFSGALGERGDRNLCWNVETDILHVAVTVAICPNFSGRSPLTIVSCVCGETCIKIESLICHMAMQPPLSFSFWAHFYTHKVRGWVWNPSVSSVHSVEPTSESTFPLWLFPSSPSLCSYMPTLPRAPEAQTLLLSIPGGSLFCWSWETTSPGQSTPSLLILVTFHGTTLMRMWRYSLP